MLRLLKISSAMFDFHSKGARLFIKERDVYFQSIGL